MVSFELGKKIEKDVFFVLSRAWGEEKILSPYEESNPRPLDSAREVQKIPPRANDKHSVVSLSRYFFNQAQY